MPMCTLGMFAPLSRDFLGGVDTRSVRSTRCIWPWSVSQVFVAVSVITSTITSAISLSPSPSLHTLRAHLYLPHACRRMAAWLDKEGKPLEFEWQGRGTKLYVVNNKKNYYPTIQFTAHGMGGKSRCQLANKEWITRLWAVGKDAFLQALQAKGPPNPQKQQDHAMLKAFMEAIVAAEQVI